LGERRQLSLDSANTGGTTTCLPSLLVLNGGGGVSDPIKVERKFPTTFWNM
jgi:hypothetical protein